MITYNRVLSPKMLESFESGGSFHELVRLAKEIPLLDLQFRGVKNDRKATMYFGLTSLMSLKLKVVGDDVLFSFVPHAGKEAPKSPMGKDWLPSASFPRHWTKVTDYLHKLMASSISSSWIGVEGAVQSSLEATDLVAVLDREVVLGFSSHDEREQTKKDVRGPFEYVIGQLPGDEQWKKKNVVLGNELDVLAVDESGRVLLIELKPATSTAGIAWSAAQVGVYRDLFERWLDENPEKAPEILDRMLAQRQRIGLAGSNWKIRRPVRFVPVVGIGGDVRSKKALLRLRLVQEALVKANVGDPKLEVWEFGMVKRRGWKLLPQE